jgi:predicted nucleic-acid-binding protein
MKITADTNILVRALTEDDSVQSPRAQAELAQAELVAIPSVALSELVWVLTRGYRLPAATVADAIRRLLAATNVTADRRGAEAGLAMLDAGGDFTDGVIAHEGAWLGGGTFVSFDLQAVVLLQAQGHPSRLC